MNLEVVDQTELRKELFLTYLNWILKQLELEPIEQITDFKIDRTLFQKIDYKNLEKEYLDDMLFKGYTKKELHWFDRKKTLYILTIIRSLCKLNNYKLDKKGFSKTVKRYMENFTIYSIINV